MTGNIVLHFRNQSHDDGYLKKVIKRKLNQRHPPAPRRGRAVGTREIIAKKSNNISPLSLQPIGARPEITAADRLDGILLNH